MVAEGDAKAPVVANGATTATGAATTAAEAEAEVEALAEAAEIDERLLPPFRLEGEPRSRLAFAEGGATEEEDVDEEDPVLLFLLLLVATGVEDVDEDDCDDARRGAEVGDSLLAPLPPPLLDEALLDFVDFEGFAVGVAGAAGIGVGVGVAVAAEADSAEATAAFEFFRGVELLGRTLTTVSCSSSGVRLRGGRP